jgi:hypothetical protein
MSTAAELTPAPASEGARRATVCAGHGWEIGGASPLRGLSEATASRRQLHGTEADVTSTEVFAVRSCGMEARDEPQHRTQVNPCAGGFGLGQCARQHDARYPTVTEFVVGAAAAGHSPFLPQEISTGPRPGQCRGSGSVYGGNDAARRLWRSRITPYERGSRVMPAEQRG